MSKDKVKFSIIGYILFFLTISISVTISIAIFELVNLKTKSMGIAIFWTFITVAFLALNCATIDLFRRKQLKKPVDEILEATERVMSGEMNINLSVSGKGGEYEDIDKIIINLNNMIAELRKKEIFKNDFISNLSHEIKTPLAVIQNYVMVLQSDNLTVEKRNEYQKILITNCKKLTNLVSNILKLNKLENQVIVPAKKLVNLGEILRQCIISYEELFEKKELYLECEIDDVESLFDEGLFEIIANNLISNAIKFTNEKGNILISLSQVGSEIIFMVKDNGIGMNDETGKHIFEKFYQGDTSHSKEGNGLGLALVKRVIDTISGSISVTSELGKGSTFIVKFEVER